MEVRGPITALMNLKLWEWSLLMFLIGFPSDFDDR
jgi:hypothetical protein